MHKLKIGILFGGCGEEHPVSVKSANEIYKHLDLAKYDPVYIGITKNGGWKQCKGPFPGWEAEAAPSVILSPDRETHGVLIIERETHKTVRLDAVFPVLHGNMGEDGSIQGLLELSGIPYVGCGIQSSAACMDKSLTYTIVKASGINTPGFKIAGDGITAEQLRFPVFVKPARSGSSFGVNKVSEIGKLKAAVEEARLFDSKVLIEEAVDGLEVGCAVMEDGDDLFAGEIDQITLSHGFFKIHQEEKPEEGSENATITVPADIPAEVRDRVRETAKRIFRALGCSGLARVDMFLAEDGRITLNEVNTMPGFTSYSRYPRMMAAAGIPMPVLIDKLIQAAMRGTR